MISTEHGRRSRFWRRFSRLFVVLAWARLAAIVVGPPSSSARPNVIVILTDDQGTVDAGCYGATDLRTPNMDALAARGVRFTQFYAGSAVCAPSRAALLTGRYPLRAGFMNNPSPLGKGGLPAAEVTVAETLKAGGYVTAHVGKWHLGHAPATQPNNQGFDESFGHLGGVIDNYSHFSHWGGPSRHDLYRNGQEVFYDGRYFPDLMVRAAADFIRQNRQRPFFLYFALNVPHYPYQPETKWLEHYRDLPYPRNLYAAFVSTADERIGTLMRTIEELGLGERTIIVFQSDHGHSTEARAHGGGGSAGPYRGAKFSLFEGGIRVPAILSWPGHLPEGAVRDQVAHSCDWLPTIAELCGVPLLNEDIDGKSLAPVIRREDAPSPHRVLHWQMFGADNKPQWAVREGDWKLLGNVIDRSGGALSAEDRKRFLAHLARDPSEQHNFASAEPAVVERLLNLRIDWLQEQGCELEAARLRADAPGPQSFFPVGQSNMAGRGTFVLRESAGAAPAPAASTPP